MLLNLNQTSKLEIFLQMQQGYVLNFTDNKFRIFFNEHNIDIDNDQYYKYGSSKAKRMRAFLELSDNRIAIEVLEALAQDWVTTNSHQEGILKIVKDLQKSLLNSEDSLDHKAILQPNLLTTSTLPTNNVSNMATIIGDGSHITQTIHNYFGIDSPEQKLFKEIEELAQTIQDNTEILRAITEMKKTLKTPMFIKKYVDFMSVASSHLTIFAPILAKLSEYL